MKKTDNSGSNQSLYSIHPAVAMIQAIIKNLPKKTGRSLDEWIQLVKKSGPKDRKFLFGLAPNSSQFSPFPSR